MKREIRVDRSFIKRSLIAGGVFILVIKGTLVWASRGGDKLPAYPTVMTATVIVAFAIGAAILVSFVYYLCPRCNRKLSVVKEAKPAIHYYCPDCNIEWDLGWRSRNL
jgi:predicted RNA-binding Zn-ribbon protein involved in translation (DUF1610 family)